MPTCEPTKVGSPLTVAALPAVEAACVIEARTPSVLAWARRRIPMAMVPGKPLITKMLAIAST